LALAQCGILRRDAERPALARHRRWTGGRG
jgi:hypothetical protein